MDAIECALVRYQITTAAGAWLGDLSIQAKTPGDGLYSAAKQWARTHGRRLVEFEKFAADGCAKAILQEPAGKTSCVKVWPV
jgi:hypothetical protein